MKIKLTILMAGLLLASTAYAQSHTTLVAPINLRPLSINESLRLKIRPVIPKPTITVAHPGLFKDRIVIKFKEGSKFRVNNAATSNIKPLRLDMQLNQKDKQLLSRNRLTTTKLQADLTKFNQIIAKPNIKTFAPLFSRPIAQLKQDKVLAESRVKVETADLSNYFSLQVKSNQNGASIVDDLNKLDSVEVAYLAPIGEDADIAPATSNMQGNQGYLDPAPSGIDAKYAWTKSGGRGAGIKIVDIEQGWNLAHEDLGSRFLRDGVIKGGSSRQHGTAVLGVVVAKSDNHGVTGISNQARYGVVSAVRQRQFLFVRWEEYNVAEAINVAASKLNRGDVIIIEQHAKGPGNSAGCACNCGQYRYVAMEYWQAEFDAIKAATGKGIVVVEAAGNGGQNLDHARYNNRFKRSQRDSGAILVGGGRSTNRAPMCWTNYGSRLDLQGWGNNVASTGYGDIKANGNDDRQWYTRTFSGTSSASPVVAGAVAAIQGIQRRAGNTMSPQAIRRLLVRTGTPQASSSKKIGPLPNLKSAIASLKLEDCNHINPTSITVRNVSGKWLVLNGNSSLLNFNSNRAEAIKARNVIRHYGMNKQCYVGRPKASFTYFLKGTNSPSGTLSGEDCIGFNRANLRVIRANNRWKIADGSRWIFDFENKRSEAQASLALINKYRFTRTCYVGRPKPGMTYLRK